jgi:hypothetical protein
MLTMASCATQTGRLPHFDAPGAGTGPGQGTSPFSINEKGEIAGWHADANHMFHGYVRDEDGAFTTFDAPGAGTSPGQGAFSFSINEEGEVVGS